MVDLTDFEVITGHVKDLSILRAIIIYLQVLKQGGNMIQLEIWKDLSAFSVDNPLKKPQRGLVQINEITVGVIWARGVRSLDLDDDSEDPEKWRNLKDWGDKIYRIM